MIDRDVGDEAIERGIGAGVEPIGLERQRPVIGWHRGGQVVRCHPVRAQWFVAASERGGRADPIAQYGRRHQAGGVDRQYRAIGAPGEPFGLPPGDERRLILDKHRRALGGEAVDEALLAGIGAVDVLHAGQPALAAIPRQIAAGAEDEPVQPVGRMGVILAQAVIDQHGEAKGVCQMDRRVDHRIVTRAQGLLQPAQDVAAVRSNRMIVERPRARGFGPGPQRGGNGRGGDRGCHHR